MIRDRGQGRGVKKIEGWEAELAGWGDGRLSATPHPSPRIFPSGHEGERPSENAFPPYLLKNIVDIAGGREGRENRGSISENNRFFA